MAPVEFSEVTKDFAGGVRAVDKLNLAIPDGEFVVLVGPSGCGKTTALRMAAGLEAISAGTITIGGRVVNDVPSAKRDIAMVFQNYALYPHMSVFENMAFGLQQQRLPRREVESRVREIARLLELEQYLTRKPRALSGGQRQRVAMGRAIVRDPSVFLMDEPLSNLDAKLRVQMRAEIRTLQRNLGTTTVYVTHDQVEAMTMGDRVVVLRSGVLQQVATPHELYHHPANLFVAEFIGSPAMNVFEASIDRSWLILGEGRRIEAPPWALRALQEIQRVGVGVRPEAIELTTSDAGLPADVVHVEDLGAEVVVHLQASALASASEHVRELTNDPASPVEPLTDTGALTHGRAPSGARIVARLPASTRIGEGAHVAVRFDVGAVHLFDLETGEAIPRTERRQASPVSWMPPNQEPVARTNG